MTNWNASPNAVRKDREAAGRWRGQMTTVWLGEGDENRVLPSGYDVLAVAVSGTKYPAFKPKGVLSHQGNALG